MSANLPDRHLVQILLPLYDNIGRKLPQKHYRTIQSELTERFQGLTAYNRAPAKGLWVNGNTTRRDEIIVYEVMASSFQPKWWRQYRSRLEKIFRQECIVIRCQKVTLV